MNVVPSLLQAIVQVNGEAFVMHAGDTPYVVTPTGQVDLASRGLTLDAVNGIVSQLLPPEVLQALDEFGAAQYQLPPRPDFPNEQFTVIAARGGDDIWAEIRRRRIPEEDHIPEEIFGPAATSGSSHHAAAMQAAAAEARASEMSAAVGFGEPAGHEATTATETPASAELRVEDVEDDELMLPSAAQLWKAAETVEPVARTIEVPDEDEFEEIDLDEPETLEPAAYMLEQLPVREVQARPLPEEPASLRSVPLPIPPSVREPAAAVIEARQPPVFQPPAPRPSAPEPVVAAVIEARQAPVFQPPAPRPSATERVVEGVIEAHQPQAFQPPAPRPSAPEPVVEAVIEARQPPVFESPAPRPTAAEPAIAPVIEARQLPAPQRPAPRPGVAEAPTPLPATAPAAVSQPIHPPSPHRIQPEPPQPAVVLPIARNPIRPEAPASVTGQAGSGLDRLLRLAAARGASTLYLATEARPSVRVDGENQTLEGEPTLTSYDVESLLLTLMPERSHEALRTGAATEWICDIEDVGRVRCMSFRDQRGPGGVFRLMAGRAVSMDQLALSREIQALAIEPEGLVLVVGPRSSGKRTMISAFIDLINRTRRDHLISIESEINIVHDRGSSFISQREVRGSNEDVLAAARGALREDPDVLVIEDLRTGALMNVALEAAASGHLVIGGFSAHSATGAIDRIIDLYAPEYRRQIQMALAQQLQGIVAQVLLRKNSGGRLAARELLLNTPAVAGVIAEGQTSQLPMAIEGGRRHGMVPLNDALVGFVQSGAVDAGEAYRRSADRAGFLSLLKRQGIDTADIERLA